MKFCTDALISSARRFCQKVNQLTFATPTELVYNPLDYAWEAHELYLKKYAKAKKKVIFLGMNPGPWGMAQTGVPFGEVHLVKNWLNVEAPVRKPPREHPKRPIEGFLCKKSEVSGRRLWGYFKEKFRFPEVFFEDYFVANYCPLVFMEESSKNRTPDKLKKAENQLLYRYCDQHLREVVACLEPEWVIGIGGFALQRAHEALKEGFSVKVGKILHPSPASPLANKNWAQQAETQLIQLGVF